MANVEIDLPAVDGGLYDYLSYEDSCKELIHNLWSDDYAAPPVHMRIKIKTSSGKLVQVVIPYDASDEAAVSIDGEWV